VEHVKLDHVILSPVLIRRILQTVIITSPTVTREQSVLRVNILTGKLNAVKISVLPDA
jgi:hypothetical protein